MEPAHGTSAADQSLTLHRILLEMTYFTAINGLYRSQVFPSAAEQSFAPFEHEALGCRRRDARAITRHDLVEYMPSYRYVREGDPDIPRGPLGSDECALQYFAGDSGGDCLSCPGHIISPFSTSGDRVNFHQSRMYSSQLGPGFVGSSVSPDQPVTILTQTTGDAPGHACGGILSRRAPRPRFTSRPRSIVFS